MASLTKKRRRKLQKKINRKYGYQEHRDADVEVRPIGTYGRGVFAVREFTPGEIILEVGGQLHRQKDYAGSTYVMELDKRLYLEPDIPACFVNHSCNPNCELIGISQYNMVMVALCNIEPDVQVCFDYQWPARKWIPRCECGAPNCRGWVVATDQVDKMKKLARRKNRNRKPR